MGLRCALSTPTHSYLTPKSEKKSKHERCTIIKNTQAPQKGTQKSTADNKRKQSHKNRQQPPSSHQDEKLILVPHVSLSCLVALKLDSRICSPSGVSFPCQSLLHHEMIWSRSAFLPRFLNVWMHSAEKVSSCSRTFHQQSIGPFSLFCSESFRMFLVKSSA